MSKTPERLAEDYAAEIAPVIEKAFLAGYKAAQEHAHAALEEAEARHEAYVLAAEENFKRLEAKLDQVADADKVMPDTCEHILDMEKMVDVNPSNNSNGWISVKDRLPGHGAGVLVTSGGPGCSIANYFEGSGFYNGHLEDVVITHWMPLPEPPKEEQ